VGVVASLRNATTVDDGLRILVATDHGLVESTDGGATLTTLLSS
jgi:hypothetical protein